MRWLIVSASTIALAAMMACSSQKGVEVSDRWSPYPGCNAAQCTSWYEACSADCINDKRTSVTECENKCRAKMDSCNQSCAG